MQGMLQHLEVSNTCTTPLHPQSDSILEHYIKTVEEHLWKTIVIHQRDWNTSLPIFLIAYRASTHDTTGLISANVVIRRELRLPCDLGRGPPLIMWWISWISYTTSTVMSTNIWSWPVTEWKPATTGRPAVLAAKRVTKYDYFTWPTPRENHPSFNPHMEDPCKVVTQINDVVYRIPRHPRMRMMVVHLDHLALYKGTAQDEQPLAGSS
jgi:hypothetical protein